MLGLSLFTVSSSENSYLNGFGCRRMDKVSSHSLITYLKNNINR